MPTAPNIWATNSAAIHVANGGVDVLGGSLRNNGGVGIGLRTSSTSALVHVTGVNFHGFAKAIENFSVTTRLAHTACSFGNDNAVVITSAFTPVVASAATVEFGGEFFNWLITGAVPIGTIASPQRYAGKPPISILAAAGAAFTVLVGGNISLTGGVNYPMVAGDTLTLMTDGSAWYEVGRSKK